VDHGRGPDGWDCYGLVYYLNNFILRRPVPSYFDAYPSAVDESHVQSAILYHSREWVEVELADIQRGDTLVFNVMGLPIHCGLAMNSTQMLHCLTGRETVVESFRAPTWNKRIAGVYRWK